MKRLSVIALTSVLLAIPPVMWTTACATGASAVTASTYARTTFYRSATAYVQLPPEQAFNSAVKLLLERGDIEITDLKEAQNRCSAVSGDQTLTLRVIEYGDGRSRISILMGGGDDPAARRALADDLIWRICGNLGPKCELKPDEP